jgi:hypothetical protein
MLFNNTNTKPQEYNRQYYSWKWSIISINSIININHYDMHTCNINDKIVIIKIIIIIIKFIILLAIIHEPVIRHKVHAPLQSIFNHFFWDQDDLLIGHTNGHLIIIIFRTYLNVLIVNCSKLKYMSWHTSYIFHFNFLVFVLLQNFS